MLADFALVNGYMREECWARKGPEYGNQGGQRARWAREHVDEWLARLDPEVAVVMFGTNDLSNVSLEDYEADLREVVRRCLDHGTVVILSTIPPRHGNVERAMEFNAAVGRIVEELRVPLVDYHGEIMRRRPEDWDGALERFAEYEGYEAPTLISRDGVHPSNPRQFSGAYSAEALNKCGFSLRNYMVLRAYAEVIRKVLRPEP
jgi:hypothetical protein